MCGSFNPISAVTGAVGSVVSTVTNTVGGLAGDIPVIGSGIKGTVEGIGAAVDAVPNFVHNIASGQNVVTASGNMVTGVAGGAAAAGSSAAVGVFNAVTPTGVQELPLISNVETYNSSAVEISNNTLENQNSSKGTLENFYRNGLEIAATVATAGAVSGAGAGADATATTASDLAATDAATAEIGSETAMVTTADAVSTGSVVSTDIGVTTASSSLGALGTAGVSAAGAGGLAVAKDLLSGKTPSIGDFINGASSDLGVGNIVPKTPAVAPTKSGVTSGGSLGGSAAFGSSQAQNTAAVLVAMAIAGILLRR